MTTPIVAIVGRPNVGKSTLFNRLAGKRLAIVHDEPGVTRDRHYTIVTRGRRPYTLIDTGGFDPLDADPMRQGIKRHIDLAVLEADVIVCVLDATGSPTSVDHAELDLLRRAKKPVIYVANKADSPRLEAQAAELYELGIKEILAVSAAHGLGMSDLEDSIEDALPPLAEGEDGIAAEVTYPPGAVRVAVIGKPNAGKSSLVNKILGEERLLVDDRPGTTRDSIDTVIERDGTTYVLCDTAGIRRKAKVKRAEDVVEGLSVMHALRAIERCEVVVLLCDAATGVAEQDAKILGLAVDRGRAVVIALNKADLLDKREIEKAIEAARDKLTFVPWAPVCIVSAVKGRGVKALLEKTKDVAVAHRKRVTTGELNRFFEKVLLGHPPPTHGGRAPRLFFITQAESSPPTFVVMASDPDKLHFSYQRYVQNQIRQTFGFEGVPIVVHYRARRRRERPTG